MKVEFKNSDYKKQRKLGNRFDNYNQFLKWTIFDKSYSRVIDTLLTDSPSGASPVDYDITLETILFSHFIKIITFKTNNDNKSAR